MALLPFLGAVFCGTASGTVVPGGYPMPRVAFVYAHSASTMELNWLEDFLALAERRNFSRAAEARHVTQPAFSRRIRALEDWVGTPLVLRSSQGVVLNAAGEYPARAGGGPDARPAADAPGCVEGGGARRCGADDRRDPRAVLHLLPRLDPVVLLAGDLGTLNLVSDTMAACERILLAGDADFLLCHCRADVPTGLDARRLHQPRGRHRPARAGLGPRRFGRGPLGLAGHAGGAGAPAGLQRGFGPRPHPRDDAAVERQGAVA